MREEALKDFTKSQILWLENKKKLENTDVSILKKKQRGALLKLQHECGEMQRMRKALLTLSEKRKATLIKTKRNLELKLTDNVDVDKILLNGKKKFRRPASVDRSATPLKCFELSVSSGCDESVISKNVSKEPQSGSAEKCVQAGDSVLGSLLVDCATYTAAENFVVVDGSYLNILFHNLALPQIFSGGKQYEVNEEALRNILHSANTLRNSIPDSNVIERLLEHFKSPDCSSTPSTARSLVEEFDQYYKGLVDIDESKESPSSNEEIDDEIETTEVIIKTNEAGVVLETCKIPESHVINKLELENINGEETTLLHDLIIDNLVNKSRDQLKHKETCECETNQVTCTQMQSGNINHVDCVTSQEDAIDADTPILYDISVGAGIQNQIWEPVANSSSSLVTTGIFLHLFILTFIKEKCDSAPIW